MKYCNSNSILHSYHVKRRHNLWNCKNVCVAETFEKLLLSVALSDVGVGLMVEPFFCYLNKYVGQKYSPKNKYSFAIFNNDRRLSLDDKTKNYVHRNTVGLVQSSHEVTQLG